MAATFIDQALCIPDPTLTEENLENQKDRVFLVTGGYTRVGYELCKILYRHDGTIYIAGRDREKANQAISKLQNEVPRSSGRLEFLHLDLADLENVRDAAAQFMSMENRLDVLVNNAGVMTPPAGSKTKQGLELQMGTNCVGPYLFTKLLLPILRQTAKSTSQQNSVRITWAGSIAIDMYSPKNGITFYESDGKPKVYADQNTNYGQSKAGNAFLSAEFARLVRKDGIVSVAWNPGNLRTELHRDFSSLKKKLAQLASFAPIKGAYTELYAGWSRDITLENTGCYVIPWGRIGSLRKDVELACKSNEEGRGTGVANKFIEWCERETAPFAPSLSGHRA